MDSIEIEEKLCKLIKGDWYIKLDVCNESAWSAELRITPKPNATEGPDVSTTLYLCGLPAPQEAMDAIFKAFLEWKKK